MILDTLCSAGFYESFHPRFAKAFDFLRNTDLNAIPDGIHEIDGQEIFVNVQTRELKLPQDALLEVHDKYIDIQVLIRGEEESFGWSGRGACTKPKGEMSVENDVLFFEDKPDTYYTMRPGEFSIFFPGDAHAPMIGSGEIKKCIVKVLV